MFLPVKFNKFKHIFLVPILCVFISCSSSSGGEDNIIGEELARSFLTECGVVDNGTMMDIPRRGERVAIDVVGVDTFIITPINEEGDLLDETDKRLVRLHGLRSVSNSYRILHGIDVLKEKLSEGGIFVSAGNNCFFTDDGGGTGVLGQIFTFDGINISELMLSEGSAEASSDICGGDSLSQCYDLIDVRERPLSDIELGKVDVSLSPQCGLIDNGNFKDNISKAEIVSINALSNSLVLARRLTGLDSGNSFLVKLQGVSAEGINIHASRLGINHISDLTSPEAYLVLSGQECLVENDEYGTAILGHIFSKSGESVNESLISNGFAAAVSDSCSGDAILECYSELQSNAPEIVEPPSPPAGSPSVILDEHSEDGFYENIIRNFLWKPVSERDGRVVVLVNPLDVRVVITGNRSETLVNFGPSNGRGTTARGSGPGCSYGNDIKLEFYNSNNELIPVRGAGTSVTVPNGCQRMEFRR